MQTKYEQITELRETATLINQLEFKIQFNSNSIEQLTKYNSHKENTDLINKLTAITDRLKADLQKHKEVFDLLLSNIKPYQSKEVERELKVGDILVCHSTPKLKSTLKIGNAYTIDMLKEYGYSIVILVGNDEVYFEQNNTIDQYYWKKYFTLK
mgnify:FL=1